MKEKIKKARDADKIKPFIGLTLALLTFGVEGSFGIKAAQANQLAKSSSHDNQTVAEEQAHLASVCVEEQNCLLGENQEIETFTEIAAANPEADKVADVSTELVVNAELPEEEELLPDNAQTQPENEKSGTLASNSEEQEPDLLAENTEAEPDNPTFQTKPKKQEFLNALIASKKRSRVATPVAQNSAPVVLQANAAPVSTKAADLLPVDGDVVAQSREDDEEDPVILPENTATANQVIGVPEAQFQGLVLTQGDDVAARARVSGTYPFSPYALVGGTLDLTVGNDLAESEGLSVNELYVAASPPNLPNLRFVVGQMDLSSYFDRNSFAKDEATHFFNPVFRTNPALSATAIASRPGVLVNWAVTDNVEAKAAAFSSSNDLGDFAINGFAGEVGVRFGTAIIRGTYVSAKDAGSRSGFDEIFQIARSNGEFGIRSGDREDSYGINGEVYIPNLKLGLFGRYGRYENRAIDRGGNTYSLGFNLLDVFQRDDRLGLAYGRGLSNEDLRDRSGGKVPDVLEAFYDFRLSPNLRAGFSVQQRDEFSETVLGVRVKTEFDLTSVGRLFR